MQLVIRTLSLFSEFLQVIKAFKSVLEQSVADSGKKPLYSAESGILLFQNLG